MALDYSQKQLLSSAMQNKRRSGRGKITPMRRKQHFMDKLQLYAFWTGLFSTLISLCQVIIIALKN